jgi:hypothetical protein
MKFQTLLLFFVILYNLVWHEIYITHNDLRQQQGCTDSTWGLLDPGLSCLRILLEYYLLLSYV